MTNATPILLVGSVDCNDRVSTRLMAMTLGKPGRSAEEYGGPTVDIAAVGSVDTSQLVESRFTVEVSGASVDAVSAIVASISAEVRDLSDITVGLKGSAYTGTLKPRIGECIEIPLDAPMDSALMNAHWTRVEIVVRRGPVVYGLINSPYSATALDLPTVLGLSHEAGQVPAPHNLALDFGALECRAFYAGLYPDPLAVVADFIHEMHDNATWSGGAAWTEPAGWPDGVSYTTWRTSSAAEVYADIDVSAHQPGEYLLLAKCKATVASAGTIRHEYIAPAPIPTTTLGWLELGVVSLPTSAVRGTLPSLLRIYLAGDGANYGWVNAVALVPVSFGGFVGWRRPAGDGANKLAWEGGVAYADDACALSEAIGSRQLIGHGGSLFVIAEQATPAPTTAATVTVAQIPRHEQLPTAEPTFDDLVARGLAVEAAPLVDAGVQDFDANGARLFAPGGVNYATNPSFEAGTAPGVLPTGWSDDKNVTGASPYTVAAALGDNGSKSFRIRYTGAAGDVGKYIAPTYETAVGSFAPGDVLHFSCLQRGSWVGTTLNRLHITYCDSSSSVLAAIDLAIPASGGPVTLGGGVYAAAPAGTSLVGVCPQFGGIDNGNTIDVTFDDMLISKAVASPYFDGGYSGCAWAGAANASTSTRTASSLSYAAPVEDIADEGTVALLWYPDFASTNATVEDYLLSSDGTGPLRIGRNDIGWVWAAFGTDGSSDIAHLAVVPAWAAGNPLHTIVRWDSEVAVDINHEGQDASQVPTSGYAVGWRNLIFPTRAGAGNYSGRIGLAIVSRTCQTDKWKDALQANAGAAYAHPVALFFHALAGGDTIYPFGPGSRGYTKTPLPSAPELNVVVDGNSMSSPSNGCYGDQMKHLMTTPASVAVVGVGGNTTPQMEARATITTDPLLKAGHTNILCVWEIANDIDAGTAVATAEASFQTYCEHRQAAGWTVVVLTLLPRSHATTRGDYLANRATCNTWLRANWPSFADAIADVAADPRIGDDGDSDDVTYYADKIHMTTTGYGVVASIVLGEVERLA